MTPTTLHRIWLGGDVPRELQIDACAASRGAYWGDAEQVLWTDADLAADPAIAWALETRWYKEAMKHRVLAAKDFIRLVVLHAHGGIYTDWDVEWLTNPASVGLWPRDDGRMVVGFEDESWLCNAVIMAPKGHVVLQTLLERYSNTSYDDCEPNERWALRGPVALTIAANERKGDMVMLEPDYLYPLHWGTRVMNKTARTVCVHYYNDSPSAPKVTQA